MSVLSALATEDERGLLERAARWPGFASCADLTVEAVRQLAAREGTDFATALLYDRVLRSPVHGPFLKKLQALTEPPVDSAPPTVVIVPGAFYREFPHTGADGQLVRAEAEALGSATDLVPLVSFGPLRTNARILCDWLERDRRENLVLVSLSKGGSDVKTALAEPGAAELFRKVAFWVNLSGLLHGTALVGWLFSHRLRLLGVRLLFWWRGYDFSVVSELARGSGAPLEAGLSLPDHLRAIHVVGFPLARHLSNGLMRRGFRRVRPLGPNDGAGILLSEACQLPGLLFPVWGADHYLRPAGLDMRAVARQLLLYVRHELSGAAMVGEDEPECRPLDSLVRGGKP
jgi:hypothetical protein